MPILKNSRHEIFALAIFAGMSQKDAAIHAGYKYSKDNVIRMTASRLLTFDNVKRRIAELHGGAAKKGQMDESERRDRLSYIAREDNDGKFGYQRQPNINAIAELNKLDGLYEPVKVDLTPGLEELLEKLRPTRRRIEESNDDDS